MFHLEYEACVFCSLIDYSDFFGRAYSYREYLLFYKPDNHAVLLIRTNEDYLPDYPLHQKRNTHKQPI